MTFRHLPSSQVRPTTQPSLRLGTTQMHTPHTQTPAPFHQPRGTHAGATTSALYVFLLLSRPFPTRRFRLAKGRLSKRKHTHTHTLMPTHTIAHSQTSKMSWHVCSLSPLPSPLHSTFQLSTYQKPGWWRRGRGRRRRPSWLCV